MFILIVVIAFILRFWQLGSVPILNADEAAIGYNAYSLLSTGKDEHGNSWPVHFQSFNDFKPGLYFYLVLPFVKVLGLNEWAVRIPGATFGVGTVVVVYFLLKELSPNQRRFQIFKLQFSISEVAALFLAISPWHLHFSRGGWEVNVSTFFITTGVWLFLKSLKSPRYYFLSFLAFAASLYTYHSARIIVPLIGIGLATIYFRDIKNNLRYFLISVLVVSTLLTPLVKDLLGPAGVSRASGVGILADPGPVNRVNEQRGEHDNISSPIAKIIHNKQINYTLAFVYNWAKHYRGEFLFLSGDEIQRNKVPETGQMYLLDLIFLIFGITTLVKNFNKENKFILYWLAIAPVAAALTFQSPHALRAHNMIIPLVVISATGFVSLLNCLKSWVTKITLLRTTYILLAVSLIWSFARYEHMYWIHMIKEYPFSSQYGVKELVTYVVENQDKYKNIVVTDRYDQPYVLFLFYLKYPPQKFQGGHILTPRDQFGFSTVRGFDKYIFESIHWDEFRDKFKGSLIVGTDKEIPDGFNIIKRIYFPNGDVAFKLESN
ncbi:glycosyltransferase family 39 protein [Candidatus Woesebacteria bacterium]|nr:glycosyltransferase family 39 protein [Candidatus Woesebacteria bacterium]